MIFIIGGSSQGKLEFAQRLLQIDTDLVADGEICSLREACEKPVLDKLHLLIKRLHEAGQDPTEVIIDTIRLNPSLTIISDELGTGVIPIQKEDREIQELVGRIQCLVAKQADLVYRVHCGIPVLIKGNPHGA